MATCVRINSIGGDKMMYYKNDKWNLCSEIIRYIQRGEEIEQYVGQEGRQWWIDFEKKWEHTEIIEFIPIEHTEEEIARLAEVNQLNIPDGYGNMLENYVKYGAFPDGLLHPLKELQIQKENEKLEKDKEITMKALIELHTKILALESEK